ncbi:MAG: hypothetical protein Q9170_005425 [Blastenia crenularia]
MAPIVQLHHYARSESSKSECKDYKLRGIDTGPCGSNAVNYTSIVLIVLVVVSLCFAAYMKTKRSRRMLSGNVRPQPVTSRYQSQRRRQKREQQEHTHQQRLLDEHRHRRHNVPARATTDLSGQQNQLSERMTRLQQRIHSLQERQRRGNELPAAGSGVPAPGAVHLRDREGDWERYQLRSNQDITAGSVRAGSIIQRVQSSEDGCIFSATSWQQDQISEPLPKYTVVDPLANQGRAPDYVP